MRRRCRSPVRLRVPQMSACFCCGAQVETVYLDMNGGLHSCPPADLARWMRGQRLTVDEGWWARLQAEVIEEASVEPKTATPPKGWMSL